MKPAVVPVRYGVGAAVIGIVAMSACKLTTKNKKHGKRSAIVAF